MRISIVIPNYNSGPLIERAIRSVLAQTYRDYQLIVADSCSTDESAGVIERYRSDLHILIREKDRGQADGLNKGFAKADGHIRAWLCADDELLPDAFETVVSTFQSRPDLSVVIGACERVFADQSRAVTVPPPNVLALAGRMNLVEQPSCFWRADLHRRMGELDTSYNLAFDWDWWCRMHRAGAVSATSNHVFSRYYFSETNKTSVSGTQFVAEASRILQTYGPLRGALSYIYQLLFWQFDMHGCYDSPPTCSAARGRAFGWTMDFLRRSIGEELAFGYNWHFASLQARGLKWW